VALSSSASEPPKDRLELWAHGETNAVLFRRALLPGPDGALVATETVAPLRQDVRVRARNVDTPWDQDSVDIELSAWALSIAGEPSVSKPLRGDVQTANVGYRRGPLTLRLGRQIAAGGAARYVRFDGLDAGARLGAGFEAGAYGGLAALPQWDQQPGYFVLGTAGEALRRDPAALAAPNRMDHWLAGGRLGWASERTSMTLGFHEQRETEGLARRNLGATARATPLDVATVAGNALVELDSGRLADGRLWVDVTPLDELAVSAEYLHTEPSLLLSRQAVLSVFSTEAYDEAGGGATFRPLRRLSFEGGGWIQIYDDRHPGMRGELTTRFVADRSMRSMVRVGYGRVLAPDNGYHSVRASFARQLAERVASTLEAYAYFYDEAIRDVSTSMVYAGTLSWRAVDAFSVLFGASAARSPYALFDAQGQVRLSYDFDRAARGRP
jgi:hypothetical protein